MKKYILIVLVLVILGGCSYKIVKDEAGSSDLQKKIICMESGDKYLNEYLLKLFPNKNPVCQGDFSILQNYQKAYSKALDTCLFYYDLLVGSKDTNCKIIRQQFNRVIVNLDTEKQIYYYDEYQTDKMDKMIPTDCTGDNKCLNLAEFDNKLKELFND